MMRVDVGQHSGSQTSKRMSLIARVHLKDARLPAERLLALTAPSMATGAAVAKSFMVVATRPACCRLRVERPPAVLLVAGGKQQDWLTSTICATSSLPPPALHNNKKAHRFGSTRYQPPMQGWEVADAGHRRGAMLGLVNPAIWLRLA